MSENPTHAAGAAPPSHNSTLLLCVETGFGLLEVTGHDASDFLHAQFSSDVRALAPGQAQYSSYNTAKGRMLANLLLFRTPGDALPARYGILLAEGLAERIRERLARYVLRAKVTLANRTGDWPILGLAGDAAGAALAAAGSVVAPLVVARNDDMLALGLPDGRALVLGPREATAEVEASLARQALAADQAAWTRADIDAGVAWVVPATSERFVPQMLNWDVLGGISFRKGCYPGQEIVARMHYLGRLKERLLAFATDADSVVPGATLRSPAFGDQACGTVAAAAPGTAGGTRLLAVTQLAAAEAGDVSLADHPQAKLTELPLPYALPQPVAEADRAPAAGNHVGDTAHPGVPPIAS